MCVRLSVSVCVCLSVSVFPFPSPISYLRILYSFDYSHTSCQSSQVSPPFLPFVFLSFNLLDQFVLLRYSWVCDLLEHGQLSRDFSLSQKLALPLTETGDCP